MIITDTDLNITHTDYLAVTLRVSPVGELRVICDRALCDHRDAVHEWRAFLQDPMPVYAGPFGRIQRIVHGHLHSVSQTNLDIHEVYVLASSL